MFRLAHSSGRIISELVCCYYGLKSMPRHARSGVLQA